MKAALLDVFISIQDERNATTIQARFDQSNAAQRDFLRECRAIDGENRSHKRKRN